MNPDVINSTTNSPLFDAFNLNPDYFFGKLVEYGKPVFDFITSHRTWEIIGFISVCASILALGVIIFSIVRLIEIQLMEKEELEHELHLAELYKAELERKSNPKWKYILTLVDSPNDSDWRVAIIEADTLLEEVLKSKELFGNTVSELLESARASGYQRIQDAWDSHLIRNKIAHEGQNFPLSQVEARKIIRQFQNFFEELEVI